MKNCIIFLYKYYLNKNVIRRYPYFYYGNNTHEIKKKDFLWVYYNIMTRFLSRLLYFYLQIEKTFSIFPEKLTGEGNIIISLTTFPSRIKTVWMVIDSLFYQSLKPVKIVLYLTEEEFPDGYRNLPKRLVQYEKLGLKICFRNKNLMPHNKYFYAFQEYSDKLVVTVDDDYYYYKDMLSNLYSIHKKFPSAICSNITVGITFQQNGNFDKYDNWRGEYHPFQPDHRLLALGYGGVLYPAHLFKNSGLFDIKSIETYCLKADDLWLKMNEILLEIPVVTGHYYPSAVPILNTQSVSLQKINCSKEQSGNDMQWISLAHRFNGTLPVLMQK
jgi:hypothetical protein